MFCSLSYSLACLLLLVNLLFNQVCFTFQFQICASYNLIFQQNLTLLTKEKKTNIYLFIAYFLPFPVGDDQKMVKSVTRNVLKKFKNI